MKKNNELKKIAIEIFNSINPQSDDDFLAMYALIFGSYGIDKGGKIVYQLKLLGLDLERIMQGVKSKKDFEEMKNEEKGE